MQGLLKDKKILILAGLALILLAGNIASCTSAYRQKMAHDREMANRIDAEEKASRFTQEKSALEQAFKLKSAELEQEKAAHEATKKTLTQEQMVGQSLKEDLNKVTKSKEALEEELKAKSAK